MPAMSPPRKRGTRKLSEVARLVVAPRDITETDWPAVERTCREKLGVSFDDWQHGAGRLILAKRADGNLAAMIDGVGMSLPRQVGKTYLVGAMVFALCVNVPGLLVIWSAHHARTHGETFLSMQGFAKRAKVSAYVSQVFVGSGDEEIRFHNGSRILFGARERGFGRGIPGVDILMFDEAQILSDKALSNMLATMNTSRFGLALFVGTPPRPEDNSEAFERMRAEATAGQLLDGAWIEFGADRGSSPDDRKAWARANPSFPKRTPVESMLRLKRKLTLDDFMREGLGIWDEDAGNQSVIDMSEWGRLRDATVPAPESALLAVDVAPDRKWASIGVASELDDGRTLVMTQTKAGTAWVIPALVGLRSSRRIDEIAVNVHGQGVVLVPDLREQRIPFVEVQKKELGQACAAFQEAVPERRLVHVGQSELDAAIRNAKTRYVDEAEHWDRRDRKVDISALVACSLAAHRASLKTPSVYEDRGLVTL